MSGEPVQELFVWVAHYADGTEDFEFNDGLRRHSALLHTRPDLAKSYLADLARAIKSSSQHAPNRIVGVELRRFVAVTQ